jgi:EmrB/QacA subfamily drug resistance transporter
MEKQSSRWRILFVCCLSLFIVGLDVTVVNVALPAIGADLGASRSGLQWTIDAYTVVMASLLLFAGSMGDRLGRKRVFLTGLAVFSAASVLCSLAPSAGALVGFRVLQAVGASMLNPVAMSIIANTFTEPRERAQAVGIWGAVFGISMALGPVVGGTVVAWVDWRAIFWINLPVGVAAILLTLRYIPDSRAARPRRLDPLGQALVMVLLAALTFGIIEASPVALAVAAVALVALLRAEPRRPEPLVDLQLFRSLPFSTAIVTSVAAFAAFGGFLFLNTLYLQGPRGLSPVQAGLLTAPLALMIVIVSPLSGRIVGRRGPRIPLMIAGLCLVTGAALLLAVDATTPLARLIAAYVVFGVGLGFVNAPITNTAVSGLPRARAGVAAAMATTSRQVGLTLGVAVASGWWVLVGCGAVVLVLAASVQTRARRRSTDLAADERLRVGPSAPA